MGDIFGQLKAVEKGLHQAIYGVLDGQLKKQFGNFQETFGYETKYKREKVLNLPKTHANDAVAICCDENEKVARHPMSPTWPETMLTTITLTEEDVNRTRVTINWEVYGEATAIERETFHKAKGGMTQGWSGSFEKLEEYLRKINS